MKILYSKNCTWEYDFILNNFFEDYEIEIEDFNYTEQNVYQSRPELINNCIIVFSSCSSLYMNNFVNIIKLLCPKVLVLLSDEFGCYPDLMTLNKYTKLLLHNYCHSDYLYKENCLQFPLGYVSGFLKKSSNINI